jgi:hypothetical protein
MVLLTIQGRSVNQFDLAKEMSYKEGVGTRNVYLSAPFEKRELKIQNVGRYSNLDHLVRSVDNHQYSIINIRFDEKSNYGHYVVVTGYNETGFFVNDPWPEKWADIVERDVGENAYLSDESLKKLWSFRKNWVITIAGPESEHIQIVQDLRNTIK